MVEGEIVIYSGQTKSDIKKNTFFYEKFKTYIPKNVFKARVMYVLGFLKDNLKRNSLERKNLEIKVDF
jgi:hypothetical protein